MTRFPALGLAALLAMALPVRASLGDSLQETLTRYGQPVAETGRPGEWTSTRTFSVSGLQITCGYVNGQVEMETYARDDRDFNPAEVEALLRTNDGKKAGWILPRDGYVDGTYTRSDGVTATLTGTTLAIQTPQWTAALAKDQAAEKAADQAAQEAAAGTNTANPNYTTGAGTNAASYTESPAKTNAAAISSDPSSSPATTTTNAP